MKMDSCSHEIRVSRGMRMLCFDCTKCLGKGMLSSTKCLGKTLSVLFKNKVDVIRYQKEHYTRTYDREQLEPVYGFVDLLNKLSSKKPWVNVCDCKRDHREWKDFLENLVTRELFDDPVGALEQLRTLRKQYNKKSVLQRYPPDCVKSYHKVLDNLTHSLEETRLIRDGSEKIQSVLQPSFIPSLISLKKPPEARAIKRYRVLDSQVTLLENSMGWFYFLKPSELSLSMHEVKTLNDLRDSASEKYVFELIEPIDARDYFRKLGGELLSKLDVDVDVRKLSEIFMRYTAGYGMLEILFHDPGVRDVYVDSPPEVTPVYVDHESYGICTTNIRLSEEDLERISSKFRSIGGRPFDEANPVMDMELQDIGVRVAGVREPSTFDGIAFAFRKRRNMPWTLPKLVSEGMFSPKSAAILSYLVSGKCSILVTGARGSGKTSILTALMSEINRNDRIVLMEDTPEIPVDYLRSHGWKIEHLRNQPPISRESMNSYELSPEQNLRAALRLGESVLVLGEVRGPEAKALFEAMRVGAAGNAVLGTIHGSTPYDTWDRVTNDLQVPSTSFKAVDVVVSLGYRENRETLLKERYLASVTEVGKFWESNPQNEGAFFDIMHLNGLEEKYNLDESSLFRAISSRKNMSLSDCLIDLEFRETVVKDLVKISRMKNINDVLEVDFTAKVWNVCNSLVNKQMLSDGLVDYEIIRRKWHGWLREQIRLMNEECNDQDSEKKHGDVQKVSV